MRTAFGNALADLAIKDDKVILLVGDIGFGIFDRLRKERPKQFYNVGVIEQSMVGIAAGMALEGLKPWVFTITPFLFERAFEQIKIDVDANNANVKLVGYADYPGQGISHADVLRFDKFNPFTNAAIYYPKSAEETTAAVLKEYDREGPALMGLKKAK